MSTSQAQADFLTAHEIRVTNHGKITNWVSFALEHFEKHEGKPLVFHTLPAPKEKTPKEKTAMRESEQAGQCDDTNACAGEKHKKRDRLHPSMSTIPRLVSVVEIVKREYLKTLDPGLAEAGALSGLHQYNEIGELEEADYVERTRNEEENRQESLVQVLQGRNHLKQKRTAFMRVTLCRKEMPELVRRGATYQKPAVRKLSKSARARLKKKKEKKA